MSKAQYSVCCTSLNWEKLDLTGTLDTQNMKLEIQDSSTGETCFVHLTNPELCSLTESSFKCFPIREPNSFSSGNVLRCFYNILQENQANILANPVGARRESVTSGVLVLSFSTPCLPLSLFGVFTKLAGNHQREPLIVSLLGRRLNRLCLPVYFFYMHVTSIWKHNVSSGHPWKVRFKGLLGIVQFNPVTQARGHQGP